jgi:hypothetical protein
MKIDKDPSWVKLAKRTARGVMTRAITAVLLGVALAVTSVLPTAGDNWGAGAWAGATVRCLDEDCTVSVPRKIAPMVSI